MGHRRVQLHKLFQAVNNHVSKRMEMRLSDNLADLLVQEIQAKACFFDNTSKSARFFISILNVAGFLIEGGWYLEAKRILAAIRRESEILRTRLQSWRNSNIAELIDTECQMRLLHVTCVYCNFSEAEVIYQEMLSKVPIPTGMSIHLLPSEIRAKNLKDLSTIIGKL